MAEHLADRPRTDFERSDWPRFAVAVAFLLVLVMLIGGPVALRFGFSRSLGDVSRQLDVHPPAPELQSDETGDLAAFREAETRRLNSYGWIDREHGVVHMPIREAMKRVLADGIEGLPKEGK